MSMTKKNYVQIAAILSEAGQYGDPVDYITAELCDVFAQDNPRFDRERFIAACEPKD